MPIPISVGSAAPDFRLSHAAHEVALGDYRLRRNVILYFMREFSCAKCRAHVAQLVRLAPTLERYNAQVLIIGGGNEADATRLAGIFNVPFPVLADSSRAIYTYYGLDRILGIHQRSGTVLVDTHGIVRYIQNVINPALAFDETALLDALKKVAAD